jgi:hypothetical protein
MKNFKRASVVVKGNTAKATSTDFDGRFSLSNVDSKAILKHRFSCIVSTLNMILRDEI